ncbi:MAG: hypothetical protein ACM31G_07115 [Flavobacteriales bacterium]
MKDLAQEKRIERLANITPNLKNWGKTAEKNDGSPKDGYHRLKDNRIIRLADLLPTQQKESTELEARAAKFPKLKDCKGIAYNNDGVLKNGLHELLSGKIISIKSLEKAEDEDLKNIKVNEPQDI